MGLVYWIKVFRHYVYKGLETLKSSEKQLFLQNTSASNMKSFCFCKFLRNRLIVDVENVHIAAVNYLEMPNLIKEKLLQIISQPWRKKKKERKNQKAQKAKIPVVSCPVNPLQIGRPLQTNQEELDK